MLDIKIAFFDIDGTLTNKNQQISINTINSINKLINKGIKVAICSGRGNDYVCSIINKINDSIISISSNGALVYDYNNKKYLYNDSISKNDINYIFDYCTKNHLECYINTNNKSFANKYSNFSNTFIKGKIINNTNEILDEKVSAMIVVNNSYEKMNIFEKYILLNDNIHIINCSFDYMNKVSNGYHFFDIVNSSVNKGVAIKYILDYLNIDKSQAICFGDSVNDLDMFRECGITVAMGNAIDELKHIANYVTLSIDDDGITKFIDKYIG